jgi:hypothetical protein
VIITTDVLSVYEGQAVNLALFSHHRTLHTDLTDEEGWLVLLGTTPHQLGTTD